MMTRLSALREATPEELRGRIVMLVIISGFLGTCGSVYNAYWNSRAWSGQRVTAIAGEAVQKQSTVEASGNFEVYYQYTPGKEPIKARGVVSNELQTAIQGGDSVSIRFDPRKPRRVLLEDEGDPRPMSWLWAIAFPVFLAAGFFEMFRLMRKEPASDEKPAKSPGLRGPLLLGGGIAATLALLVLCLASMESVVLNPRAEAYERAKAEAIAQAASDGHAVQTTSAEQN
jgi:hypothetical protein